MSANRLVLDQEVEANLLSLRVGGHGRKAIKSWLMIKSVNR